MQRLRFLIGICLLFSAGARAQVTIPNSDFEHWSLKSTAWLEGWFDNNLRLGPTTLTMVQQVPGTLNSGVRVETISVGTGGIPGMLLNTGASSLGAGGGAPYTSTEIPTHLNGMYRYSINPNDSARIELVLKKNGVVISHDSFYITGTQSSFVPFHFPVTPVTVVPDTVVLAAISGEIQFPPLPVNGSFLELDELYFSNSVATVPFPHGGFDAWHTLTTDLPEDWVAMDSVSKTGDSYSGSLAAKLRTAKDTAGNVQQAMLSIYGASLNGADSLTGYYKYSCLAADSGYLRVFLADSAGLASPVLVNYGLLPVANYVRFAVSLDNNIHATRISLMFTSSAHQPIEGSTLWIDKLELTKRDKTAVGDMLPQKGFSIYPNPAKDILHIATTGSGKEISFSIQNAAGQVVLQGSFDDGSVFPVSVAGLPAGAYACTVMQEGEVLVQKFIKE